MPVKYVYGVVRPSGSLPSRAGIGDAPLELVTSNAVAALVSSAPEAELTMGRDAMTTHARVLEETHALGTVLPMRFGVLMSEAEVARELLEPHEQELAAQLTEFDGKAELKLRASYEEEPLLREVLAEDQDIARLRDSLRGAPDDATYYGRIQLGELVAAAMQRKRETDAERILDALGPLALAVDVAPPPHERIVLSASFLVGQSQIDAFDAAVDNIGRDQAERMRLKYTGPLPPHSFVTLAQEA
ncbi:MAG: GvpL/GvpF family gas vesicle protein [Actinomycetota bacterium]|nr:GvpL/GvpF family gas vesicle protein [Actinomycetota bacterium]